MIAGKDQIVIVLEWTTADQLETIKELLDETAKNIHARDDYDDLIDKALGPELILGLFNICCDLEIPGYEMS